MTDSSAFQVQYRQEFISGFEVKQSLLRDAVTNEAQIKGNQATFLIADSGGATTVTRGANGKIPGRQDNLTQKTVTLTEEHDVPERTNFNIFASQGDGRKIMQETSFGVLNRKTDSQIITTLNTGTVNTGTAVKADMKLITKSKTILGNNKVPFDGNITAVITPAFEAYLLQTKEFINANYINGKPLPNGETAWKDMPMVYKWLGINFIVHPELPGVGPSAEKCFLFHRNAVGHAMDTNGMQTYVGYDEREDLSYCRMTAYMNSLLLQNNGVVVMNHDGSEFAAS
jgi:hypothetical protein